MNIIHKYMALHEATMIVLILALEIIIIEIWHQLEWMKWFVTFESKKCSLLVETLLESF